MEKMRNIASVAATIVLVAVMAASCGKDNAGGFCGNYSFKCSGMVTVARDTLFRAGVPVAIADTLDHALVNEQGQMDIVAVEKGSSDVIVTMNITGGGLVIMNARYENGNLVIDSQTRQVSISSGATDLSATTCLLNVEGSARMMENIVVFDVRYDGDYVENGRDCHILGSNISFRAKLNED